LKVSGFHYKYSQMGDVDFIHFLTSEITLVLELISTSM
jgi:hypothetical protein